MIQKEIGLNRLEEILPTINSNKIMVDFHTCGDNIKGFYVYINNGYNKYYIPSIDIDPRYADDMTKYILRLLIKDKRIYFIKEPNLYYAKTKKIKILDWIIGGNGE